MTRETFKNAIVRGYNSLFQVRLKACVFDRQRISFGTMTEDSLNRQLSIILLSRAHTYLGISPYFQSAGVLRRRWALAVTRMLAA